MHLAWNVSHLDAKQCLLGCAASWSTQAGANGFEACAVQRAPSRLFARTSKPKVLRLLVTWKPRLLRILRLLRVSCCWVVGNPTTTFSSRKGSHAFTPLISRYPVDICRKGQLLPAFRIFLTEHLLPLWRRS